MSTNSSDEINKKRRNDTMSEQQERQLAAKFLRLTESFYEVPDSKSNTQSSSSSSSTTCSQDSSVASQFSSEDLNHEHGGSSFPGRKTHEVLQSSTTHEQVSTLKITRGNVYKELMTAFSQEPIPNKLIFEDEPSNLCDALDEFWREILANRDFFKGNNIKVMDSKWSDKNKIIAKILRIGWEKAHYFPKKISSLFLERCIFDREIIDLKASADMLVQFVDEQDSSILSRALQDSKAVPEETVSEILKKYSSSSSFKQNSSNWEETFKSSALNIMVKYQEYAIQEWSKEVNGMMKYDEFIFVTTFDYDFKVYSVYMDGYRAPHTVWHTFLFDVHDSHRLTKFYKAMISNGTLSHEICCRNEQLTAKHYLCSCDQSVSTMRRERHDVVMKIVVKQLNKAIELRKGMFRNDQWKVHVMFNNKFVYYPDGLDHIMPTNRRPHIVVYTVDPFKRMLIVELKISWEHDLDIRKKEKEDMYKEFIQSLEQRNIEVKFEAIVMGCRGVVRKDLYDLFESTFGLSQEKASRTIEKISKNIIKVAYNFLPEELR